MPASAILLGITALISLSARWFIYDIEQYRGIIVSQISKTLGLNASIAEIKGQVDLINPIIYTRQVKLSNFETSTAPLLVDQMEIVIDLFGSLLNAEPRIHSVQMAGIELAISTDLENNLLRLPQIEREFRIPERQFNLGRLLGEAIAIDYFDIGFHDILIHWDDKNMADTRSFNIEHFIVSPQYLQTQLSLIAELPKALGQKLTFITALEHDISNPSGNFYINIEDLNLSEVYQMSGMQSAHQGRLHAELWGQASYLQGLENLTGTLSLKDYLNPEFNPDNAISHFQSKLNWQAQAQSRELGLSYLSMRSEEATIENADLAIIQTQNQGDYFSNLRFQADYISPSTYNQLLAYTQTGLRIEQSRTKTPADKQAIDLILQTNHSDRWFVSPHTWPPVPLSASSTSTDLPQLLSGQFELALNDILLKRNGWSAPQNLEHAELKGNYTRDADYSEWHLNHLHIKSSDSDLSGTLSYRITDNKDKHMQSSLRLHHLDAAEIMHWIPPQTLKPKLESWLRNALRGGTVQRAELAVDGNPDFPFGKDAGLWQLKAQAEDINLAYRRDDPEIKELNLDLLLENQTLKIQSDHLRMMDFYAKDTTVLLEDVAVPYVKISSRGRGPLADILSYVKTAGLVASDSILISDLETDGNVDMDLKVHTRLSPNVERETYVGGHIDLDGANITLKTLGVDFNQLEGRLHFDKLGGRSNRIQALLNNAYPLTATAEAKEGATLLKMETRIPFPADYLQALSLPANTFNATADAWQAELLIPPLSADSKGALRLKLNSDLKALEVNMPAPLHKQSGEAVGSALLVEITDTGNEYQFDYGNRMRLSLQIPNTEADPKALLHFSPKIAYPYEANDDASFTIRGVIPHISINEWLGWLENYEDAETQPASYAQDIDVFIEKLVWNASTANQAHLAIKQQQDKTLATIHSAEIKGNASIPASRDQRVYIDLEHLILEGNSLSSDSHELDPAILPPMAIKMDLFKLGDFDIEDLKITLSPATDGVQITGMSFSKKSNDKTLIQAQLEGDWKKIDEQNHSSFKFLLNSDDYGQLLHDWNFYSGLKGGQGQINGQLNWDNSPSRFELDQLQGPVKLQIKDGSIEAIEPGIGRLFGLLNVNALARRLTLDFKDVFDKGFEFDSVQGALEFDRANLMTQNLDINGPALDMKITGRTGITQRDYDQKIIVTPHVGTNAALATAFLGGPLTVATVFLLSQVTQLDNWVDRIITLEYTLKGSWDQPEVEFISAPVAQKIDPMNTIKAPGRQIKKLLDKIFSKEQE